MNYLISEILGCLLVATFVGILLGWFLRGGCRKKLKENSLEWQEKLRIDNLSHKERLLEAEENCNQKLSEKEYEYTYKVNQLISNGENIESKYLENEISSLKKKLALIELTQMQKERDIIFEEESEVEEKKSRKMTTDQKIKVKRVKEENKFLKLEIERSVSELTVCEQENKIKEREIQSLTQKILHLKKELLLNNKNWQLKLEKVELDWVDKIAFFEEATYLNPKDKK